MKHIWTFVLAIAIPIMTLGQQPQPVYSHARVRMPVAWYKEQAAGWKKELQAHPDNAQAWYYYYYAKRNLHALDENDTRSGEEKHAEMQQLVASMHDAVPDSYEYNLVKWLSCGNDFACLPYLQQAAALGPERYEHLDGLINYAEVSRNIQDRDLYARKKYDAGQLSPGMMYYNYNVLAGTAPNALIITCGDNDTYPCWGLQALGIRPDVTVINVALLQIDEYRERLFKELGIAPWQLAKDSNGNIKRSSYDTYRHDIIQHIAANKKHYPVYVALTVAGHEPYLQNIQERLYLTGLTYLYSETPVDNMALLKKNMEKVYDLDYIQHSFYQDMSSELVKQINRNYLVPMLKLYEHYKTADDAAQMQWIQEKMQAVAIGTEDEAALKKCLSQK